MPLNSTFVAARRPLLIAWLSTILAMLVVPAGASADLIARLNAGEHQTVMAIGTSLTSGGGSAGSWTIPVAGWLEAEYPGLVTFDNCGVSGSTSGPLGPNATRPEAAPGQSGLAIIAGLLASNHPDAVFIEYATNDAVAAFDISLEQSKQNLRTLIGDVLASNPDADVILQTMNPVLWGAATARPNLSAYFEATREVAAELSIKLVDNEPHWSSLLASNPVLFQSYVPDGVHPTNAAYEAVVLPTVQATLVPEPSSLVLSGVAVVLLIWRRRRYMLRWPTRTT